jgi:3-oxoacyl-(acyl-carrier-protein) synthase
MTYAEKLIARARAGSPGPVRPGEALFAKAHWRYAHEYVSPMSISALEREMGRDVALHDPSSIVCFADHLTFVHRSMPARSRALGLLDAAQAMARVGGLDNLLACLTAEAVEPRFVVLFSSVSAAVPSLAAGQSDYALANSYMDYVAQACAQRLPVTSVQWPSWKEAGMGEVASPAYQRAGLLAHTDQEGLAMLDLILQQEPNPVVLPAQVDRALWRPAQLLNRRALERDAAPAVPMRPAQEAAVPAVVPAASAGNLAQALEAWMVALVAQELRLEADKVDVDTPLQDYGVESVMILQLLKQVADKIDRESIDPSAIYEYPSIGAFSAWLLRNHGTDVALAFGSEAAREAKQAPAPAPMPEQLLVQPAAASAAVPRPEPATEVPLPKAPERVASVADPDAGAPQPAPRPAGQNGTDIAIVGMSCRFPGAESLQTYWELLEQDRSAIRPIPRDRWPQHQQHAAALLQPLTGFDPQAFSVSLEDARAMDPQALLLLEESLSLFSHAGYTREALKSQPIGVYIGARSHHKPSEERLGAALNPILAVGPNYLAANVSRAFDLHGPSMVIDTACSSALVAMNLAINALNGGDISAAVVGGVNLLGDGAALDIFKRRGILSPDSEFHVFDAGAQGAILGEGIGLVLLKRLDQALDASDRIYAVIKGVAVNNDGRTAGASAPNIDAQKEVMDRALKRSGVTADAVDYIEGNGAGSAVTDLLELKAIEAVYGQRHERRRYLGSIKPNIGHPLCAEGIASLIKVVLMLHHGRMVPFRSGFNALPHFDMEAAGMAFCREAEPWEGPLRVAGINTFADGGTNVHVLLQSVADAAAVQTTRQPLALPRLSRQPLDRHDSFKKVIRKVMENVWESGEAAEKESSALGTWG